MKPCARKRLRKKRMIKRYSKGAIRLSVATNNRHGKLTRSTRKRNDIIVDNKIIGVWVENNIHLNEVLCMLVGK